VKRNRLRVHASFYSVPVVLRVTRDPSLVRRLWDGENEHAYVSVQWAAAWTACNRKRVCVPCWREYETEQAWRDRRP